MRLTTRLMLTAKKELKEWLVVIYDKPNVDRLKFRGQHLDGLPAVAGKTMTSGGAILNKDGKLIGSSLHLRANNESEIISFLKDDIYAKEGIWDFDNYLIHELKVAYREGKEI